MSRRSWAFDSAIALVVVGLGVLEAVWGIDATHRQGPVAAQLALYAITGALLVVRRTWPLECQLAIVVVSLAEFALVGSPEGQGVALPGVLAGYAVARWETRHPPWLALPAATVLWLAWVGLDPMNHNWQDRSAALIWLSPWLIAWLVGALVRSTATAAEQRRTARHQRAAQAVAEERNRIARELHDVIGHSVSVMTVQASAVRRRLHEDQDVEREALLSVETVGREALVEMRRMVGVLRDPGTDADREPPPGLGQLTALVTKFRAAGLPVEVSVLGTPRPLAPGLDLTAYRLVQEGLTNTLRHAQAPQRVQVGLDYRDDGLAVSVRDDGRADSLPAEAGHGLLGMRERVGVYGGHLVARPVAGGGFELCADLPLGVEA